MGQTLSEPVTVKETSSCHNDFLKVGASCMQGWRISILLILYIYDNFVDMSYKIYLFTYDKLYNF